MKEAEGPRVITWMVTWADARVICCSAGRGGASVHQCSLPRLPCQSPGPPLASDVRPCFAFEHGLYRIGMDGMEWYGKSLTCMRAFCAHVRCMAV